MEQAHVTSLALAMRALPEKATGKVIFGFSSSLFLFHLVAQGDIYPESFSPGDHPR